MLKPYANYKNAVFDNNQLRTIPRLSSYQSHIQWDETIQFEQELNLFGYRSDQFDRKSLNVLSIGCSWTYGTGLRLSETWSYLVAKSLNANNWNLAAPGASNDYVARTLLTVFDQLKPDLVVVLFPRSQRREHFDHQNQYFYNNYYRWRDHGPILKEVLNHHDGLNSLESNYINFFKNYKLIEMLLKDVPWRYALVPPESGNMKTCVQPHQEDYDFLDQSKRLFFEVVDLAKDGKHPGIMSNQYFAQKVLNEDIF